MRYAKLLAQFQAARRADPYVPVAPTAIARSFELGRELPEARVKALLEQVLTSPLVPRVAKEIEPRLGRKLEPQDLWYAGFKASGKLSEAELDALTRKRYPTAEAFAKDMPRILQGLGFSKERASFLSEHIRVDPSRGAGHAMPAMRRGDFPRLRTRVGPSGMDYKGYNIAVHELGHNVEQVFSLYDVDHTLLAGVPNNAFTEALAFVFQARDLELLGQAKPDAASERERVLNDFWQTWEIAGVALVDIAVWHWMYEHPDATPARAARGGGAHLAGDVGPVLRAGAGRAGDAAAGHLQPHDLLPAVPDGLSAGAPDRVPDRGAPAEVGQPGRGVRADGEPGRGDAGRVDDERHGSAGERRAAAARHRGRAGPLRRAPGEGWGGGLPATPTPAPDYLPLGLPPPGGVPGASLPMPSSSISNTRVALGGMTGGEPISP